MRADLLDAPAINEQFTCMEQNNFVIRYNQDDREIYSWVEARNITPQDTCSLLDTSPWLFYGIEIRPSFDPTARFDLISINLDPNSVSSGFLGDIPPLSRTDDSISNISNFINAMKSIPMELTEVGITDLFNGLKDGENLNLERRWISGQQYPYVRKLTIESDGSYECLDGIQIDKSVLAVDQRHECFDTNKYPLSIP
jgi:hypothetical protein